MLTALILSTSYSEKYKGRYIFPGQDAAKVEVRLPCHEHDRSVFPLLLHRSGNKEAVVFIWLGDQSVGDDTLYVAFSPMRYRSQFFKIYCAGMVFDRPEDIMREQIAWWKPGARPHVADPPNGDGTVLPISAYVHVKLRRMWGEQGLWRKLTESVDKYPTHRIMFAGISHGGALAQAAALQFQLCRRDVNVFVVTWNAYRWTDRKGRGLAKHMLGNRCLPFVLSARTSESLRYWDSVTGFPAGYCALPHPVLLDNETGVFYRHIAPQRTIYFSHLTMMRAFQLHFARSALVATKKSMVLALGGSELDTSAEQEDYLGAPVAERLQERVIAGTECFVRQSSGVRRLASAEFEQVRGRLTSASEEIRTRSACAADRFSQLRSSSREFLTEKLQVRGSPDRRVPQDRVLQDWVPEGSLAYWRPIRALLKGR